ncbi:MAG: hypothetical protein E6G82_01025 [Alphaproteobacteria bacterium]|nr:MAG: hypothetical protein E6G82_01025 [Alphaproteobacteria bacterium]
MKRSRRVVLTMMGTATIGAVSMGFVRRRDCGPGRLSQLVREPDGRLQEYCPVTYGGFGGAPHRLHGHFHARGGG